MRFLNYINGWPRTAAHRRKSDALRPRAGRRLAAIAMVSSLAIRMASFIPGVPVLHWHGSVSMVHAGGGLPHEHVHWASGERHSHGHDAGGEVPPGSDEESGDGAYYSPATAPLCCAEISIYLPNDLPLFGGKPVEERVCYLLGAMPPGPTRGPPVTPWPPTGRLAT